jgi:hypothetical protein
LRVQPSFAVGTGEVRRVAMIAMVVAAWRIRVPAPIVTLIGKSFIPTIMHAPGLPVLCAHGVILGLLAVAAHPLDYAERVVVRGIYLDGFGAAKFPLRGSVLIANSEMVRRWLKNAILIAIT